MKSLIFSMLDLLRDVGIPLDGTSRRLERMAMACLAVGGVKSSFKEAKSADDGYFLTTREIISYENNNYNERISPGSYDDIRRKDLLLPVQAGIVINSSSLSSQSTNNPTRGYALNPTFANLMRNMGSPRWRRLLEEFRNKTASLAEELARKRSLQRIPV